MSKQNLIWILAILAVAIVTMWVSRNGTRVAGPTADSVRPLLRARHMIEDNYHKPIAPEDLDVGAVRGMVESLDEFSTYVSPGQSEAFGDRIMGTERGFGLRLHSSQGELQVLGVLPGSPAHLAGLCFGDRIVAIDGEDVVELGFDTAREKLDTGKGDAVELSVMRAEEELEMQLKCDEFPVESVTGLYLDSAGRWVHMVDPVDGIAYLRVREFVRDTGESLQRHMRSLGDVRGVIIDLRDNPGGLLASAVEVADLFLREGTIVKSVGRDRRPEVYVAHGEGTYPDVPLVVLVNSSTASAAEIVAGSLCINDRAVLVGTRTRGKGCVQSMFTLPNGLGRMNLTTSEFFLAEDQPISRRKGSESWGVDPHETVLIMPARRGLLDELRSRSELLLGPDHDQASDWDTMIVRFFSLDAQFDRAVRLLKDPRQHQAILMRAKVLRQRRLEAEEKEDQADDDE